MPTSRQFAILFLVGLWLPVLCTSVEAQTRVSIRLQGEAIPVAGQLVWRVDPTQTTLSEIQVDESSIDSTFLARCPRIVAEIKARILDRLKKMAAEEKSAAGFTSSSWIMEEFNDYTLPPSDSATLRIFFAGLRPAFGREINKQAPSGFTRPARVGETFAEHRTATQDWTLWTLDFDLSSVAAVTFGIAISTTNARTADTGGAPVTLVSTTVGQVAADLGQGALSAEESAVAVELGYVPVDFQNPNNDEQTVLLRLKEAAFKTFIILREGGVGFCRLRDSDLDDRLTDKLQAVFLFQRGQGSSNLIGDTEWFGVPVQFISSVDIKVSAVDGDGKPLPTSDRDREIEELINRKYKPRLLAKPGTLATNDVIEKDIQRLFLARTVSARPTTTLENGQLTFNVLRRREVVSLTLTGAGAYSPEESLNGSIDFGGENILHLAESWSLKLTGGAEFQKGEFKFSIPRENPKQRRSIPLVFAGLNLDGHYLHDSNQRFGNAISNKLVNNESALKAQVSFEYDSFTERDYIEQAQGLNDNRKRLKHFLTMDLGFNLVNNNLKSASATFPQPIDGRIVYPSLALSYLATYDLRRADRRAGIGEIDLQIKANGQRGMRILGGDFRYKQYDLSVAGQVFFGFSSPYDLFLRYQRAAGASSNATPTFRLFRLGGAGNVRGLEEGELIGNSFASEKIELGIGVLPLFRAVKGIFPRRAKQKSGEPSSAPPDEQAPTSFGGIDLGNTYLKVFYDRGRVFDDRTLSRILNPGHGVKGYGIAAELRGIARIRNSRANLTIGYARSPDSLLHRNGLVVTGLSLDF